MAQTRTAPGCPGPADLEAEVLDSMQALAAGGPSPDSYRAADKEHGDLPFTGLVELIEVVTGLQGPAHSQSGAV